MITEFQIKNFRSIKDQTIPVKKLNILYGPNGSGKSSVLYAPYVMRNFFVNPNQRLDSLFNLGFINLGGFESITNNEDNSHNIEVAIESKINRFDLGNKETTIEYRLVLTNNGFSRIMFKSEHDSDSLQIDIPFTASKKIELNFKEIKLFWNGLTFESVDNAPPEYDVLAGQLNKIYEDIKFTEMISMRRGFATPVFSGEFDMIASSFAPSETNGNLEFEKKIDKYFYSIFDKHFKFVQVSGSTAFYLRTKNKNGKFIDLVNEGYGVNQAVEMLIKLLKKSTRLALIEEPEIHLHPTAQAKLMDAFCDIVQKENKQIFLTTHSENIVSSVLRKIADGEMDKNDVQFYLAKKENDETVVIPQEVNDKGQIEGGLMNFMETELSNLKTILGI